MGFHGTLERLHTGLGHRHGGVLQNEVFVIRGVLGRVGMGNRNPLLLFPSFPLALVLRPPDQLLEFGDASPCLHEGGNEATHVYDGAGSFFGLRIVRKVDLEPDGAGTVVGDGRPVLALRPGNHGPALRFGLAGRFLCARYLYAEGLCLLNGYSHRSVQLCLGDAASTIDVGDVR
ncbi:hypothetical protein D3C71_1641710 [compost metagenome]